MYIQNNIYTNTSDPTRSRESLRGKTHLFDTKSWLVIIDNTDSASLLLPCYIIISIINIFVIRVAEIARSCDPGSEKVENFGRK